MDEERQDVLRGTPESARRRRERGLSIIAVALLAVLAAISTLIFYRYMDGTLFVERNSNFIEISDKVTGIIELVVGHYEKVSCTAENLLNRADLSKTEEIPDSLEEIRLCLGVEKGVVLAFDEQARFYASDGTVRNWRETAVLSNEDEIQELAMVLDYREDDVTHILFIKKLGRPVEVEGRCLTHVGLAVDISVFQEAFDPDMFQNQSHVYVVSPDGSRLYRHVCEGGFIDSYNLMSVLESCEFIHGGTVDDLRKNLQERSSAGYEILYEKERYFVATSSVAQTNWAVLTFVPTEVLGAGTSAFLNTAILYVSAIAALVVLMMGLAMFTLLSRRSDRRIIEHQRQVNELLKDAADAANAANVAKSDFLSHMSHDIRTPINGIMGMTDIALKNLDDRAKTLDCLKKIEGSSGHLLSLVNDVLDMSRIESGKTQISHEPMHLPQVIERCVSIIGGQLLGRDVELVEEISLLEHPRVLGDELHLRQVLINILGNAVKFTPDGGKIYFRIQELGVLKGTARFRLEVEDTGIGMKPEFLPHIFEAFAQEEGGNRSTYKGTGLGMAITKKFVDLMGGTITVDSRLNVGTHFVLEFPMEIDQREPEEQEAGVRQTELAGMRLLVAEDNELNLEIAQYVLEDKGIEVVPAMDGQEALDVFSASQSGFFDGILMDVMMPVMDGLAATRAIRALERGDAKTIPIIAMTANAYDEDRRKCLEAGMNAHVAKPIDEETLFQVLSHYIGVVHTG